MGSVSPINLLTFLPTVEILNRLWRGGKRKREDQTGEEDAVEERRGAKQARKKVEMDISIPSMDSEVEMSDLEEVVHQSTLYDELYRAYMLLREPLD